MSQNDRDNFRKVTHPGMVNDDDFGQHRHYTWIGCGTFLVRCNTSPNSHRWGMGSSHITKVCHIMCHRRFSFRSYGNRRSKSDPPAVFTLVTYLGRWDLRCRNRNYLGRQPPYPHYSCGIGHGNRFLLAMVRLLSRIKTKGHFLLRISPPNCVQSSKQWPSVKSSNDPAHIPSNKNLDKIIDALG